MWLDRQISLIGEKNTEILKNSSVLVCGVGGVGGYVCEMLCRSGIGKITVIDFDVVDITNLNRQIIATTDNIGRKKVEVIKERLLSINPNIVVNAICEKINESNLNYLINKEFNYIIDCIDSFKDKVSLIDFCYINGFNIISAMGAGRRYDIPSFVVTDIFKTEYDPLAKKLRKALKERSIKKLKVVTTNSKVCDYNKKLGSISYYPAVCGCTIASFVVNELIKEK